jgi:glucose 1-dehydrogenase
VVIALAAAGADVVVNFVSKQREAEDVAAEIHTRGRRVIVHRADVSNEDQVRGMFERILAEFGTIDILVNNAGIQRDAPFEDMTLDDWRAVLNVNLTGQFLCAREAVREFKRRGVVEEVSIAAGKIISMSSVHEIIPWAGHVNYAASKAGASMMTKSIAQEVAPYRIRVNSIAPGAIKTKINEQAWRTTEALSNLLKLIPYNRIGTPEDVANAAVWLASDASDYVHGATLFIDGGMTLYPGFETGG